MVLLSLPRVEFLCNGINYMYLKFGLFGSPIVLLLLRTSKPMRMEYRSMFLEVRRGPRETVLALK